MDSDDRINSLASLKQSIMDSEASLRQMKQTIEVVDARLRQHSEHHADAHSHSEQQRQATYLNAADGGG